MERSTRLSCRASTNFFHDRVADDEIAEDLAAKTFEKAARISNLHTLEDAGQEPVEFARFKEPLIPFAIDHQCKIS